MQNDDFKYVIQDTGSVYFGKELTYTEMMEREDVPFKFKAIISMHIARDTDLNKRMADHILELDTESFTYRIFEQLKLAVRVCYKEEKRSFTGRKKKKWVHKTCPIRQFCAEYKDWVRMREMVIEDISISKLALMIINI